MLVYQTAVFSGDQNNYCFEYWSYYIFRWPETRLHINVNVALCLLDVSTFGRLQTCQQYQLYKAILSQTCLIFSLLLGFPSSGQTQKKINVALKRVYVTFAQRCGHRWRLWNNHKC